MHRPAHLCEVQLDTGGVQLVAELAEQLQTGEVDVGDRGGVEHDVLHLGALLDQAGERVDHLAGGHEGERRIDPEDQQGGVGDRPVAAHVAEDLLVGDEAELGGVGAAELAQEEREADRDTDTETGDGSQQERGYAGGQQRVEVAAPDAGDLAHGAEVDEAADRGEDHRGERDLRHPRQHRREHHQAEQHQHGCHDAGDLRPRAGPEVHRAA